MADIILVYDTEFEEKGNLKIKKGNIFNEGCMHWIGKS